MQKKKKKKKKKKINRFVIYIMSFNIDVYMYCINFYVVYDFIFDIFLLCPAHRDVIL